MTEIRESSQLKNPVKTAMLHEDSQKTFGNNIDQK